MADSRLIHAARRGYVRIEIRDRGNTPRKMKSALNNARKKAWADVAEYHHEHLTPKRFTTEHARAAGYTKRKGENLPRGSRRFKRSYTGRKLRIKGHTLPLVWSGDTRRAVRFASISSTAKEGRAAYRGANKLNFRHPKSQVRAAEEFRRHTNAEAVELARVFDRRLDHYLSEQDRKS